jgi:uncharacterized SAM-binding protein YcdF (DUF218 family)
MPQVTPESRKSTQGKRRLICGFALLFLAFAAVLAFRHAGRWLVREDPLAPAGVIVVLSGALPFRAEEAAHIFRQGHAPEVWVSRPSNDADEMRRLGINFITDEDYNREVLIRSGVPATAIRIFPDTVVDTEQEVEETAALMRQSGKNSAIIVTSPPHTRRVAALWKKLAPRDSRLIVRAAWQDPFDADHWWQNTRDALAVTREYSGLMNVWAGLPIRPHSDSHALSPK